MLPDPEEEGLMNAGRINECSDPLQNTCNPSFLGLVQRPPCCRHALAMLNIEPPEPKNSGSNADDHINLANLLGMLHIVDLIC
jgi:hypothetical protein